MNLCRDGSPQQKGNTVHLSMPYMCIIIVYSTQHTHFEADNHPMHAIQDLYTKYIT